MQIFGYPQDSYNDYHRSNALSGVSDPPKGSAVYNPANFQLVCRRWKEIARPIFYGDQVAVDHRERFAFRKLVRTLRDDPKLPFPRLIVLIVTDPEWVDLCALWLSRPKESLNVLASLPDWKMVDSGDISFNLCNSAVVAPRNDDANSLEGRFDSMESVHIDQLFESGPFCPREMTFRIRHASNFVPILETIVKDLRKATYLARLRLDVPFDLSESRLDDAWPTPAALLQHPPLAVSRLDDAWPTLAALLQHPSLATGRDALFERDQTMKEIVFGTQSIEDASKLQDRVNTLDSLAVPVRVEVLDM